MLLIVGLVFVLVGLHTFTFYPLTLYLLKVIGGGANSADAPPSNGEWPDVSILVCAYNEQHGIGAKAKNLLELCEAYPGRATAFVYDDCSSDDTFKILENHADRLTLVRGECRSGKSTGMNRLVELTDAEIVVFSDANTLVDPKATVAFVESLRDPSVGCVCGTLQYYEDSGNTASFVSSAYWKLEELIKQLESDTGSVIGADGSLFAIRRALYRPAPADIIDDFHTSLSILCNGYLVKRCERAKAFEKAAVSSSEEFSRKKRIACRSVNCCRQLSSELKQLGGVDWYKLVSHKFLRWTSVGWLFLGAALIWSAIFSVCGDWGMVVAGGVLLVVVVGKWSGVRIVSQMLESLKLLCGCFLGVCQSYAGMRYQTWAPAASARSSSSSEHPVEC
ncbi:glycosyltransferase [Crateriforma conspicua]|uniref:Beta-monoglucosyldiacylglycerol synthase n=1 Tax=Crateriforma conspicua TaxID=2527996 RepID=A0A5C6FYG3_9PLAN|nr:glycosyltransferase [Crateriforma conspicua]TWU67591.1 Beta-monoglucosyldiacylglycerol synthase [Crateriforma conspicua]